MLPWPPAYLPPGGGQRRPGPRPSGPRTTRARARSRASPPGQNFAPWSAKFCGQTRPKFWVQILGPNFGPGPARAWSGPKFGPNLGQFLTQIWLGWGGPGPPGTRFWDNFGPILAQIWGLGRPGPRFRSNLDQFWGQNWAKIGLDLGAWGRPSPGLGKIWAPNWPNLDSKLAQIGV